jgi:hypothetical protein
MPPFFALLCGRAASIDQFVYRRLQRHCFRCCLLWREIVP